MGSNTVTITQLTDSSQSAYVPLDGNPSSLGAEWLKLPVPDGQVKNNWDSKGFYAEAYVNKNTGELRCVYGAEPVMGVGETRLLA